MPGARFWNLYLFTLFLVYLHFSVCSGIVIHRSLWKLRRNLPKLECITSCVGRPDGDYQSCQSCDVYASCSNERLYDNRLCSYPEGIVWDDYMKRCEWFSSTCPIPDTEDAVVPRCVRNCTEYPDGDYQSCRGCNFYISCVSEMEYDTRPCPEGLVWDDDLKRCEWTSTTCIDYKNNNLRHLVGRDFPVQPTADISVPWKNKLPRRPRFSRATNVDRFHSQPWALQNHNVPVSLFENRNHLGTFPRKRFTENSNSHWRQEISRISTLPVHTGANVNRPRKISRFQQIKQLPVSLTKNVKQEGKYPKLNNFPQNTHTVENELKKFTKIHAIPEEPLASMNEDWQYNKYPKILPDSVVIHKTHSPWMKIPAFQVYV